MSWMRNKENNFPLRTLIWRPKTDRFVQLVSIPTLTTPQPFDTSDVESVLIMLTRSGTSEGLIVQTPMPALLRAFTVPTGSPLSSKLKVIVIVFAVTSRKQRPVAKKYKCIIHFCIEHYIGLNVKSG